MEGLFILIAIVGIIVKLFEGGAKKASKPDKDGFTPAPKQYMDVDKLDELAKAVFGEPVLNSAKTTSASTPKPPASDLNAGAADKFYSRQTTAASTNWVCPCGNSNKKGDGFCTACGAANRTGSIAYNSLEGKSKYGSPSAGVHEGGVAARGSLGTKQRVQTTLNLLHESVGEGQQGKLHAHTESSMDEFGFEPCPEDVHEQPKDAYEVLEEVDLPPLRFGRGEVADAIVYAEILAKPKALSAKR